MKLSIFLFGSSIIVDLPGVHGKKGKDDDEDCCAVWSVETKGKKDKTEWECKYSKQYSEDDENSAGSWIYECFEDGDRTGWFPQDP